MQCNFFVQQLSESSSLQPQQNHQSRITGQLQEGIVLLLLLAGGTTPKHTSLLVGAGSVERDIGVGAPVDPGIYRLKCDSSTSYQNFVLEVFWQNTSIRSPIVPCYLVSQWSISSQNLVSSI